MWWNSSVLVKMFTVLLKFLAWFRIWFMLWDGGREKGMGFMVINKMEL